MRLAPLGAHVPASVTVSDAIALTDVDRDLARRTLSVLFGGCGQEQIDAVLAQACCRQLPAGAVLLQLEERADAAYVLLAGQLQVYGRHGSAQLVPIAHIDQPGRLLGEQALLPGHRFRNAYVLALAISRVLEIPAAAFQQLLQADASALQRLQEQGVGELRQRLQRLGLDLDELWEDRPEQRSLQFEPGATVLPAGQTPASAFAIVSGQVALWAGDLTEAVMVLGQGSVLGLEAVLAGQPFGYEARAETQLELLPLRPERLRMRLGDNPLLDSLQAMHQLPGCGLLYRYRTTHEGHVCFITDYEQLPGGPVRVLQIPQQQRVEATRVAPAAIEPTIWMSPGGRNQLLVHPLDGRLVAFAVDQAWPSLGELMALLLRHAPLDRLQLEAFARSGQLLLEAADQRVSLDTQLICACSNTTATELRAAARSCESLADLQRCTGAGTVCGACLARLPLFLDQPDGVRLCQLS
ncbi:MAG: cyclic nucleotide-binding domain-containing protein, partial [Cyanobacteria bacterium K_DeepCast_35m_m2_023]|nr:cyclic nucleotide-binding domain-containing protein [Cyanobacteria bacterium K_DeepCast_35m_m2_023]